jgi:hypothetical protein
MFDKKTRQPTAIGTIAAVMAVEAAPIRQIDIKSSIAHLWLETLL